MELSRSTQFALRAVLDLATEGPGTTSEIAARRGIPPAQAGKIVQQLVRGGIVRTARGARGGVWLARPADRITLRDVVEAIEGPLSISRCLIWNDCPCDQPCPVRSALGRIQHDVDRLLQSVTLEDLATDVRRRTGTSGPAATEPTPQEEGEV